MGCCGKSAPVVGVARPMPTGANHAQTQSVKSTVIYPISGLASSRLIAQRRAACDGCAWNMENICQHPGCLPCRDRANGGLAWKTSRLEETCPAGKWDVVNTP